MIKILHIFVTFPKRLFLGADTERGVFLSEIREGQREYACLCVLKKGIVAHCCLSPSFALCTCTYHWLNEMRGEMMKFGGDSQWMDESIYWDILIECGTREVVTFNLVCSYFIRLLIVLKRQPMANHSGAKSSCFVWILWVMLQHESGDAFMSFRM